MSLKTLYAGLLLVLAALPRVVLADLSAEELVLIVNRNVPEGRRLAEFYQQARQVPVGRLLELDLPAADQMTRQQYEQEVVPQVRRFLMEGGLRDQVRCAVTFYGVPLAIEGKKLTSEERQERTRVNREADEAARVLAPLVSEAEDLLRAYGYTPPTLKVDEAQRFDVLMARVAGLEGFMAGPAMAALTNEQRMAVGPQIADLRGRFTTPIASDGVGLVRDEYAALARRTDAEGRELLRDLLRRRAGLRDYAQILLQHQRLLAEEQSHSAFDSELATLWIDNAPASRWLANPLAGPAAPDPTTRPVILMVSRLDGRDPQQVRDLIAASLKVERDGLRGKIVVDSRGIAAQGPGGNPDGYGLFDEQLRKLAQYLQQNATLTLVHDDQPEVIQPPGPTEVAVYVGWYSLTKYVPAIRFEPGAVGYHVASFEMRSLRDPAKPGWVRGLLDDGVVATTGPVAEPFLSAFPPPGDFVPLLLTGKLSLAEVYWQTTPLISWQMGLIGDPLYRPFAAIPALAVEKLPPTLRLKIRAP